MFTDAPVFDAVVLHGGSGKIRTDLNIKAWKLLSETDVINNQKPPTGSPIRITSVHGRLPVIRTSIHSLRRVPARWDGVTAIRSRQALRRDLAGAAEMPMLRRLPLREAEIPASSRPTAMFLSIR